MLIALMGQRSDHFVGFLLDFFFSTLRGMRHVEIITKDDRLHVMVVNRDACKTTSDASSDLSRHSSFLE